MATIETDHAGTRRGQISSDISTQAVQIVHEYTGRGPTKARTVLNHDSVTIILQDSLTKGELKLVEAGRGDEVLRTRHAYQQVMRQDLTRIVEKALERKVIAFLSDNHAVPDVGPSRRAPSSGWRASTMLSNTGTSSSVPASRSTRRGPRRATTASSVDPAPSRLR